MNKPTWRSIVAPAIVAAIVLCGCSGRQPAPPPALGPITAVTSPEQIARPIDPYLATATQARELSEAAQMVTAQCVKGYGLPPVAATTTDFQNLALQNKARNELFGFFDPAVTATKGYDVFVSRPGGQTRPSAAQMSVLNGQSENGSVVASYRGRPVPAGGCHQVGLDAVGGWPPAPGTSNVLPDHGPAIPISDPRVVAKDKQWSACMKSAGYTYATPADAYADARWRKLPGGQQQQAEFVKSVEIPTAEADLKCKQATDYMGLAIAAQSAYDAQYIASHTSALAAYKQRLDADVTKAEHVIAAAGSSSGTTG